MPEVERTHLIAPVTRWVLETALRQQRLWRDQGVDLTMAVNVSARSLRNVSGLPDTVAELTALWDTAPGRLTLELTEGALIEDAAPAVMARLHELGQLLSIDDFGTGYSSLRALSDMPVDILKVDKSFVDHVVSSPASARLVGLILQLAADLGMRTVAEGAEDVAQVEILQTMGCRLIQGYYFSQPLPSPQLQELIRNGFVVPLGVANPKPPVGAGSGARR